MSTERKGGDKITTREGASMRVCQQPLLDATTSMAGYTD